jgi:predicted RNase H-like nuclease (RuvC/YqgF family)
MRKLTKIIVPALCATMALGAAIPAQAYPKQGHGQSIALQITELQRTVNRSDRRNGISDREAWRLRRDVQQLSRQYRQFSRNGLTRAEYRILDNRIDAIRAKLHVERHDRDRHRW